MKFVFGFVLGLILLPAFFFCYFRFGTPPVAVADQSFLLEKQIVRVPLHARIDKEMPHSSPIAPTEDNLEAGAHIYRAQCAACHGSYGHDSSFAAHMYPSTPQLWAPHGDGVVGVSDDPPGETYWKVANGIRLTGMPAFNQILSSTQMWQVSLLLANADRALSPTLLRMLKEPVSTSDVISAPSAGSL